VKPAVARQLLRFEGPHTPSYTSQIEKKETDEEAHIHDQKRLGQNVGCQDRHEKVASLDFESVIQDLESTQLSPQPSAASC